MGQASSSSSSFKSLRLASVLVPFILNAQIYVQYNCADIKQVIFDCDGKSKSFMQEPNEKIQARISSIASSKRDLYCPNVARRAFAWGNSTLRLLMAFISFLSELPGKARWVDWTKHPKDVCQYRKIWVHEGSINSNFNARAHISDFNSSMVFALTSSTPVGAALCLAFALAPLLGFAVDVGVSGVDPAQQKTIRDIGLIGEFLIIFRDGKHVSDQLDGHGEIRNRIIPVLYK